MARLVQALQTLPSVGPKTATRLALHLVQREPDGGRLVASALQDAIELVRLCSSQKFKRESVCSLCLKNKADDKLLCVVGQSIRLMSFADRTNSCLRMGAYFVLHGHLSPIDGMVLAN